MPDTAVELSNSAPSRDVVREFAEELRQAEEDIKQALGQRRNVFKRAEAAQIRVKVLRQALKLAELSGELREADHRALVRYMAWLDKPLGVQATMFDATEPLAPLAEARAEISQAQLARVGAAGQAAADAGQPRNRNPWTPATPLYESWDGGWTDAAAKARPDPLADPLADPPAPRAVKWSRNGKRLGRPPGSRNRRRAAAR